MMPEIRGPLAFPPHSAGQDVPNPLIHALSATSPGPRVVLLPNPQSTGPLKGLGSSWPWQDGDKRGEEMQGDIGAPGIWGWPGSSLHRSFPQQVLLTLPLNAWTLSPEPFRAAHLLVSAPIAAPLGPAFSPSPCDPVFPLQPQPVFKAKPRSFSLRAENPPAASGHLKNKTPACLGSATPTNPVPVPATRTFCLLPNVPSSDHLRTF